MCGMRVLEVSQPEMAKYDVHIIMDPQQASYSKFGQNSGQLEGTEEICMNDIHIRRSKVVMTPPEPGRLVGRDGFRRYVTRL